MEYKEIEIGKVYKDISGRVFLCQAKDWNGVYDAMGCTFDADNLKKV